jgi:hypothetical protein
MKHLLFSLVLLGIVSCADSPKTAHDQTKNQQYTTFQFSQRPAPVDQKDASNWCAANFGAASLIGADPKNFNRRLFALSAAATRIAVSYGHQQAVFILLKSGDHVEIFTSDNFPNCLSNKANFQISPERTSFIYNNKRDINIEIHLQELANGMQIALDLPPDSGHGLTVDSCEFCK